MAYLVKAKAPREEGPEGQWGWHASGRFWPVAGVVVEAVTAGMSADPMLEIREQVDTGAGVESAPASVDADAAAPEPAKTTRKRSPNRGKRS